MIRSFIGISETGKILDVSGLPLYEWKRPETWFNMPDCAFVITEGEVRPAAAARTYDVPEQPAPPAFKTVCKPGPGWAFAVRVGKRRTVIMRPLMFTFPLFVQAFIFLHEVGHHALGPKASEKDCDIYAACSMLKEGWNPSQVWAAAAALHFVDQERKAHILKFCQQWTKP